MIKQLLGQRLSDHYWLCVDVDDLQNVLAWLSEYIFKI